ncbi:MAG: FadR family transcriptional regulator [Solirubrobacteraceae bacterium]|nr:FadR family transcriptional regulator [Solirubrobacteraceae bacterium]
MSDAAPIARRPLRSDEVHDRLRRDILSGELQPGEAVPSERALSERLGVNRHAVREAIKRLQQAGLVVVNQGGATRVLDWQTYGGLDLLGDVAPLLEGAARFRTLRSVAEMRASIGTDAARLCAREGDGELRAGLPAVVDDMAAAEDYEEQLRLYEVLWMRIVMGSGNLAYRLAFNSLVAARHGAGVSGEVYASEVTDVDAARAIADAIADGDEQRAAAAARTMLDRTIATAESLRVQFEEA